MRHLENLLISLGMKGKPSIGKAKTLKEQRELAQELSAWCFRFFRFALFWIGVEADHTD